MNATLAFFLIYLWKINATVTCLIISLEMGQRVAFMIWMSEKEIFAHVQYKIFF